MKPIKFKGHNIVMGKDQKEYQDLPAHAQADGIVTMCFQLDKDEVNKVIEDKQINLTFLNFNRPVQPHSQHVLLFKSKNISVCLFKYSITYS